MDSTTLNGVLELFGVIILWGCHDVYSLLVSLGSSRNSASYVGKVCATRTPVPSPPVARAPDTP
jgi:hypothetical protein